MPNAYALHAFVNKLDLCRLAWFPSASVSPFFFEKKREYLYVCYSLSDCDDLFCFESQMRVRSWLMPHFGRRASLVLKGSGRYGERCRCVDVS